MKSLAKNLVMDLEIIDNFLPDYQFKSIQKFLTSDMFPWYYNDHAVLPKDGTRSSGNVRLKPFRDRQECVIFFQFDLEVVLRAVLLQREKMSETPVSCMRSCLGSSGRAETIVHQGCGKTSARKPARSGSFSAVSMQNYVTKDSF